MGQIIYPKYHSHMQDGAIYTPNWTHPLMSWVRALIVPLPNSGCVDLITGLHIPRYGSQVNTGATGGLTTGVGTGIGARVVAPNYLRFAVAPVSLFWVGRTNANNNSVGLITVTYESTNTSPYDGYGLVTTSGGDPAIAFNNSGTRRQTSSASARPTNRVLTTIGGSIKDGSQALYKDGKQITTGSYQCNGINYGTNPTLSIGLSADATLVSCYFLTVGIIFDIFLTADDHADLNRSWFDLFQMQTR